MKKARQTKHETISNMRQKKDNIFKRILCVQEINLKNANQLIVDSIGKIRPSFSYDGYKAESSLNSFSFAINGNDAVTPRSLNITISFTIIRIKNIKEDK